MAEVRTGVFICRCGTNIGGYLDVPRLVEYAKSLPDVVFSTDNLYTCSETGLKNIKEKIAELKLNRLVVASCTPRTHEYLFKSACKEAGLNPYLFDFVNIRDQCSWVHMKETEKATQKAMDLIRMGVARARLLEPQEEIEVEVVQSALVVGGGIAGLTCSQSLADQGYEVTLVEKEDKLGGLLKSLYKLYPTQEKASDIIETKIKEVEENKNIEILTSATIKKVEGFFGNYDVTIIQEGKEIPYTAGVIITATGAQEYKPFGSYNYDGVNVITQLELEHLLKEDKLKAKKILMIQCVGSRNVDRPYCSKICCITALKNALIIAERDNEAQIFILYRDIQTYGFTEELYSEARMKGINFLNYSKEKPPEVKDGFVTVFDENLGEELNLPFDIVVLSTPMIPQNDTKDLAKILRVPTNESGFLLEAHVKLRPIDFATDGIYLCGSCRWPSTVSESVIQGLAAASRAAIPMSKKHVITEPTVSKVDEDKCIGCKLCEIICPYNAIRIEETPKGRIATTILVSCKGCGLCGASCPQKAIEMIHFKDEQILAEVTALLEE